jgi:hypothetical protein
MLTLRDELECGSSEMQECIAESADDTVRGLRRRLLAVCTQNSARWNFFPLKFVQFSQKKLLVGRNLRPLTTNAQRA